MYDWIDLDLLEEMMEQAKEYEKRRKWEALTEEEKRRALVLERAMYVARLNNPMAY